MYLGHVVVARGVVTPIKVKLFAPLATPFLKIKKSSVGFLGMAGYYKFCRIFSEVTTPLTEVKKNVKYHWPKGCQRTFDKVKNVQSLS